MGTSLGTIVARIDLETIAPSVYLIAVEGEHTHWQPLGIADMRVESDTDARVEKE